MAIDWNDFFAPVWLSLKVSLIGSILVFVLAAATARWMAKRRFMGKSLLETVLLLPLVLPPTVIGFLLLMLLGRRSWIGEAYEWFVDSPIVFSWIAAVIAAVVIAFPLAYRTMKAGFEDVDPELEKAARVLGANEWQVFRYVTAPLASRSLVAGFILGFARALGEFGATLMIAGNIPHRTQTIPTAIYVAIDGGKQDLAWAWCIAMVLLSFVMLLLANGYSKR
ncbi:molybdate ABC transporter permease subunit [Cohnella faecalis]|uniref:Molybdenum transport system permease n=1 Tax=Cohnella faecalis TaxID=2315694 RepID=A0A398CMA6_9BACL|nr:molybdate ABC transporter permease subunit [Cohnella faecalis]RIE03392.1 molybdate ABC transporter permease subunit [Cohnella faecalis]